MLSYDANHLSRREFLGTTSAAALAVRGPQQVSIVIDPADAVAAARPPQWAAKQLEDSLAARGISVTRCEHISEAKGLCIVSAGPDSPQAKAILTKNVPRFPESLALATGKLGGQPLLLACGYDSRGLVYALLELADRVQNGADPIAVLDVRKPVIEQPANAIRGINRQFTSEIEDKPWFNDREMWPRYMAVLAAQRFNRFSLSLGIGYDFLRQVTDAYFVFAYPFFLDVPGYRVRVPQLADAERDRNLAMLQFISDAAAARGLEFQLGIWMHGYKWIDSPHANYTIEGLAPETHGPYCRDALRALFKACPAISGVTFRIHGESGVEEGSYEFWKTVFEGAATCGRKVEIDMHAKGMDQGMIDVALGSGMPVRISPKYWAEHMGMPYHQADIRELERPRPGRKGGGLMNLSTGSRSFLRYGYGDLLREDRKWRVLFRIWPGTQRLLLWGDPVTAAAHSRAFRFCGSDGVDIMEPLSCKGRRGSGIAGGRSAYADASLMPHWDWEKYLYTYRVWGRLLYNPGTDPDVWRRYLDRQFGPGAQAAGLALANASRILPIVTTAHGASAANNAYWPEMYTNQSIVRPDQPAVYGDTPAPKVFGNVSPLDPQLFSRINDYADGLMKGERSGKYSPLEVAQWLEDYAAAATAQLAAAESRSTGKQRPEYRRFVIDVAIQSGLGRFFGAKFRSAVLYRIYEQSGDPKALEEALKTYRFARAAWAELADRAKGVYMADITVGEKEQLRGHWMDRLAAIDQDIALMEGTSGRKRIAGGISATAIKEALARPKRVVFGCHHTALERFHPGQPISLEIWADKGLDSALLYYRRVNQAERFESREMEARGGRYRTTIPAEYTKTEYPLQYYFELKDKERALLYPGFEGDLTSQPYFVVRRA